MNQRDEEHAMSTAKFWNRPDPVPPTPQQTARDLRSALQDRLFEISDRLENVREGSPTETALLAERAAIRIKLAAAVQ